MAMNRQTKRMLQRQGELAPDGTPVAGRPTKQGKQTRPPRQRAPAAPKRERVGPRQYVREVQSELRKVAWPTRQEVVKYSIIVLVAVILLTSMIAALDYVFTRSVFFLFDS